ncbi:PQQ-dependent sugar dehydrogenase [Flavihumibacter profundi]|uniref:PQQ-dependent sugar dehydrogenase n=1 Tax=Flavihumibacter profundi TaxID=2716883 RepID=UPI001CC62475|nr:PQQ-dependent sugar dehydrogenase [Flavihumibacter profundi]MBZ5857801.1 PQQ-dependent sugar dehydrogenase [Flavihumibacter profundi]
MKQIFYIAIVAGTLVQAGCTNKKNAVDPNQPNTNYKPAFTGQTRINKVKTVTPFTVERINEKLGRPWAIVPLPDGRLMVSDKSGFINIVSADGAVLKKITGLPPVDDSGQGGLLDLALDPEFATNKIIYWTFSEKYGQGNLTAVAKGELSEADGSIKNPVVIFRATPDLKSEAHYGSRLLFDKDGYLFVSAGERSILDGRKQAQWLNSGLGKVFRITKDGKPAPGNPFVNQADAKPEIYSYGHRNPQSLDINPVTGDLWEAEFGPRGGDELNLIKPGKNYGWPVITYGIEYDGRKIGDSIQQKEGMEQPVYYWDPVVSPSGMIFYTGDAIPEWKNNLFIGGLSSMQLIRLVIENNKVVGEESLLSDQKERIRDVTQLNGKLYAVSDGGILFRISKK